MNVVFNQGDKMSNKKVTLKLEGMNGNAFSIIGSFTNQAKKEGWTKEEISEVTELAMSGNYDHLLRTIMEHTK